MMKGEKLSCHQENFKNHQVAPYQILQYIHRHLKLHISLKIKKKYPQLIIQKVHIAAILDLFYKITKTH